MKLKDEFPFTIKLSAPIQFNEKDYEIFYVLQYIEFVIGLNKGKDIVIVNNSLTFKSPGELYLQRQSIIRPVDRGKFEIIGEPASRRLVYTFTIFTIYGFDMLYALMIGWVFHSWGGALLSFFVIILVNFFIAVWRQQVLVRRLSRYIEERFCE